MQKTLVPVTEEELVDEAVKYIDAGNFRRRVLRAVSWYVDDVVTFEEVMNRLVSKDDMLRIHPEYWFVFDEDYNRTEERMRQQLSRYQQRGIIDVDFEKETCSLTDFGKKASSVYFARSAVCV